MESHFENRVQKKCWKPVSQLSIVRTMHWTRQGYWGLFKAFLYFKILLYWIYTRIEFKLACNKAFMVSWFLWSLYNEIFWETLNTFPINYIWKTCLKAIICGGFWIIFPCTTTLPSRSEALYLWEQMMSCLLGLCDLKTVQRNPEPACVTKTQSMFC